MIKNFEDLISLLNRQGHYRENKYILDKLKLCGKHDLFNYSIPRGDKTYSDSCDIDNLYKKLGENLTDLGLLISIQAHVWGLIYPIFKFGSEMQRKNILPLAMMGELIGGHAISESKSGSDIKSMSTTYYQDGEHFILKGKKCWITNSPIADSLIVYAKCGDQISAFLVYRNDENVTLNHGSNIDCFIGSTVGEVLLDGCKLPLDRLVGRLGLGPTIFRCSIECERLFIFSCICGVMRWQLKTVISYIKNRYASGGLLSERESVRHKIAKLATHLKLCELLLSHAAETKDQNTRITVISSQVKLVISEYFFESTSQCIQIMGAHSLECIQPWVNFLKDAAAAKIISGTNEIQMNIIANIAI